VYDSAVAIEYARHAEMRMAERHVQPFEVAIVLAEPDEVSYGEDGELIARRLLHRRIVEVVYVDVGDTRRVITVLVA
jgi:hypothetical protein